MGNLAVQNQGANALAAYGGTNPWADAGRGSEQGTYLQFNGNHGTLVYGSDDVDLPVTSLLVPDMTNYAQGWICWKDSAVAEEVLVPILDGKPPREAELDDHGPYDDPDDGWREAGSMPFVILEYGDGADSQTHEDVGKSLLLKTSTGGAVRALKKLSASYGRLFLSKPGMYPIVEMKVESYTPKNKKFGIKWGIDFKIVDWIPEAELAQISGGFAESDDDYVEPVRQAAPAPEPEPEPEPVTRGRRAAPQPAPEPEPEVVDEVEVEDLTPPAEEAPATTGRRGRSAPAEQPAAEPAATGRRGRGAPAEAAAPAEDDGETPLQPRGRSAGRGAPPTNARVRRF